MINQDHYGDKVYKRHEATNLLHIIHASVITKRLICFVSDFPPASMRELTGSGLDQFSEIVQALGFLRGSRLGILSLTDSSFTLVHSLQVVLWVPTRVRILYCDHAQYHTPALISITDTY